MSAIRTEVNTIQGRTINGKACRQYNIKNASFNVCYIVPIKFAALTN